MSVSKEKCEVVMLATNEKSNLFLAPGAIEPLGKVVKTNGSNVDYDSCMGSTQMSYVSKFNQFQHLYITKNEILKNGDYYIWESDRGERVLGKVMSDSVVMNNYSSNGKLRKVIATTDILLYKEVSSTGYTEDRTRTFYSKEYLPSPSDEFIEKYIKLFNRNKQITNILVEYEEIANGNVITTREDYDFYQRNLAKFEKRLKKSTDNKITIHHSKEKWSRNELEGILKNVLNLGMELRQKQLQGYSTCSGDVVLNKWIEENL